MPSTVDRGGPPGQGRVLIIYGQVGVVFSLLTSSAALAAFGVILILVPLVVRALLRRAIRSIDITRNSAKAGSEGDRVTVQFVLSNHGPWPLFGAVIRDVFGAEALAPEVVLVNRRIDAGTMVEAGFVGTCRKQRGIYPHGPVTVAISDPFGWFEERRRFDLIEEFKVYPRLRSAVLPDRVMASISEPAARHRVLHLIDSDEFVGVREYRPGDPLKRIHWPLTARRDVPVVREYLPSVDGEVALFLDVSRKLRFSGALLTNFESSVRFLASLAARAVRAGYRVQLRAGGQGTFDVRPLPGASQLGRILEALLRVRTRDDTAFRGVLRRNIKSLPRGCTAIVTLHPYAMHDAAMMAAFSALVAHGTRVVVIVYGHRLGRGKTGRPDVHRSFLRGLAAKGIELWDEHGGRLRDDQRVGAGA